ncbi:MAG: V-type ATPase subunit [Gammaproteobacteria bacterium]|nr:V-type ATPase subunit [Gammaproteobacteria bacterium]MBU1655242.1 V-type ATPase subunit [Gammaproteobacteria bacterium]MBU1961329.1 V-type ATPase subunit [Gammaproteobacteria bacterium]
MTHAADQAYLRTRLAIMRGRLRGEEELNALIDLPPATLLEGFGLHSPGGLGQERLLVSFEQSLLQLWLDELTTLLRPLRGPAREILMQWARRYELFNLKALIRGKLNGMPAAAIRESLFRLPAFLALDHERLLQTDNLDELLRRLDNGPYGSLARQARRRFAENQDPFLLDATLDQYFYTELSHRLHSLEGEDLAAMTALIGRIVDRHNLIWMLRYRYNYALSPAQAFFLAIDHGFRIGRSRLARLVEEPSLEQFLAGLPDSICGILGGATRILVIEARMKSDLAAYADHCLRHGTSIIAAVFAFLILRYYEINDLFAIVQARMAGLDDDILREALHPEIREAA